MRTSEGIKNIAKALAQFQAEVKNPANTADNPFFKSKYAPLNDILNLVRPILSKYGLSVIQSPSGDGQNVTITTLILHESGEWVESDPLTLKADKATAQGAGSAITYARRYAISAMLGISSEDDDDGNYASGKAEATKNSKKASRNNQRSDDISTDNQRKAIYAKAGNLKFSGDDMKGLMMQLYKKDSSKKLTKAEASDLLQRLSEMEQGVQK